jgi:hypothetical protein
VDFKGAFKGYVEKRMKRMAQDRAMDDEERNKMLSSIALGRKDMHSLLIDVGITMKRNEV